MDREAHQHRRGHHHRADADPGRESAAEHPAEGDREGARAENQTERPAALIDARLDGRDAEGERARAGERHAEQQPAEQEHEIERGGRLQAERARIPFANVGLVRLPDEIDDDDAILLSDIFPTAMFGADIAEITDGDTVAVFGCGPVGQLTIASALLRGAGRVRARPIPFPWALGGQTPKLAGIMF